MPAVDPKREGSVPASCALSVAIPTYERGEVLVDTIGMLLALAPPPDEILVLDQTANPAPEVVAALEGWQARGLIRWQRLERPSITEAMNQGLRLARCPLVLFIDDDVIPDARLVKAHAEAHRDPNIGAVVGQILQPGQTVTEHIPRRLNGLRRDFNFPFNSSSPELVWNCAAGNLSVKRTAAIGCGGFDERFVAVAYRFETEFCRRLNRSGVKVLFQPTATLRHLKSPRGGTRSFGDHQRTAMPHHAVGDYYYALREGRNTERWLYVAGRFARAVRTRFHATHPWWIPITLVGEVRGFFAALSLHRQGPRYLCSSHFPLTTDAEMSQ